MDRLTVEISCLYAEQRMPDGFSQIFKVVKPGSPPLILRVCCVFNTEMYSFFKYNMSFFLFFIIAFYL